MLGTLLCNMSIHTGLITRFIRHSNCGKQTCPWTAWYVSFHASHSMKISWDSLLQKRSEDCQKCIVSSLDFTPRTINLEDTEQMVNWYFAYQTNFLYSLQFTIPHSVLCMVFRKSGLPLRHIHIYFDIRVNYQKDWLHLQIRSNIHNVVTHCRAYATSFKITFSTLVFLFCLRIMFVPLLSSLLLKHIKTYLNFCLLPLS